MTITFIGHGYVGLVTACVFADLGNTVYVIGRTPEKLQRLKKGDPIIFEPGLAELLQKNLRAKRLHFTDSYREAIPNSEVIFLAVGTPPKETGEADLTEILKVAEQIGKNLKKTYTVVSCKSTVPVGTNRKILALLKKHAPDNVKYDVASCPEFLREGTALNDTFEPDRIVIGSESKKAIATLLALHEQLPGKRVITQLESAEIIKYASNSLLATKISFANMIAQLCEKTGANAEEVMDGVGLDRRIGRMFLNPGIGYGGSCFPKDVLALIHTGKVYDVDMTLLQAVDQLNKDIRDSFLEKIVANTPGKKIGVWGLAFKPNTDDIRFSPALSIINKLVDLGFTIQAYDPEAMTNSKKVLNNKVKFVDSAYQAVENQDALVIFTEWNEFKQADFGQVKKLLKTPLIIDGRNIFNPEDMSKQGFTYISVGR